MPVGRPFITSLSPQHTCPAAWLARMSAGSAGERGSEAGIDNPRPCKRRSACAGNRQVKVEGKRPGLPSFRTAPAAERPNAAAQAPGLHMHPVRRWMLCRLASFSTSLRDARRLGVGGWGWLVGWVGGWGVGWWGWWGGRGGMNRDAWAHMQRTAAG